MIKPSSEFCKTKCWNASRVLVSFTTSGSSSLLQSGLTEPSVPEILTHLPSSRGAMMKVSWGNSDLNSLLAEWSEWILAIAEIWKWKSWNWQVIHVSILSKMQTRQYLGDFLDPWLWGLFPHCFPEFHCPFCCQTSQLDSWKLVVFCWAYVLWFVLNKCKLLVTLCSL